MRRPVALASLTAIALLMAVSNATSAAGGATLSIDQANVAAAMGQAFNVTVEQDAPVATSGAQASIDFDPRILQVTGVSPGSAYATAPVFAPRDIAAAIRLANESGHLAQIAAAFTPPNSVPPGPASFMVIGFWVKGCGQTDISLPNGGPFNAQMISGESAVYGTEVPVFSTTGGHVTTCVGTGAVTADSADAAGPSADGKASSGTPVGLIGGAAGFVAAGLFGGLALRWRRRTQATDHAGADKAW